LLKKELEADTVVGIDISAEMINLALDANCQHPLGCKYEICDAAVVPCYHNGRYDLVLGMYLLNYASCREQLYRFAQQAFKLLKPGGRFIGYNNYPGDDPQKFSKYRKYGFEKRGSSTQKEGDAIVYMITNPRDNSSFEITNYYLPLQMHQDLFDQAGFTSFEWQMPQVSPQSEFPQGYWDDYTQCIPMCAFEACK